MPLLVVAQRGATGALRDEPCPASPEAMPSFPPTVLPLAGSAIAHAAWAMSGAAAGDRLCPIALVHTGDDARHLARFEATSPDAAVERGRQAMVELTLAGTASWAFAREGVWHGARLAGDGEGDDRAGPMAPTGMEALLVEFWAPGMLSPALLVQAFARAARHGPFRLLGDPLVVQGDEVAAPAEASPVLAAISAGVAAHAEAAAAWPRWRALD